MDKRSGKGLEVSGMGLSRLAKKCQACPYVSTCDHKRMEALGYLPLPEANVEVKVDLSATPTAELVDQLSRAVQIPKHALRGGRV